jgi:anti-sigma regulatory factor (Ser/Thr protein kinase)
MKGKMNTVSLNFISDLRHTEFCVLVLSYIKNFLMIDEDDFFKIEIALREVINNAIVHGNHADLSKRVFVDFSWQKAGFSIRVRDENPLPVDFNALVEQSEKNDLLAFRGRGIMIMRTYMDRVEFCKRDGGSEILLQKRLQ